VLNIDVLTESSDKNRQEIEIFLSNAVIVHALNTKAFNTLKTFYPLDFNRSDKFEAPDSDDFTKIKVIGETNK
jgi:hypothetical protein